MPKITKLTTDVENFQGYEYDPEVDAVPVFHKGIDLEGGLRLKGQTDGTMSIIDTLSGNVTTSVSLDVTSGSGQAITKTISDTLTNEDSSTAFQPIDTDLVSSTLDDRGRYEVTLDFQSTTDHHTEAYRSKSQTGLTNVRVQVYALTNIPPSAEVEGNWNDVVNNSWWISKRPIWQSRTRPEVLVEQDNLTGDHDLGTGDISINFLEGITFEQDEYYRVVISADNAFTLDGNANVPDPTTGGVQSFLYVERSYREVSKSTGSSGVSVFGSTDLVDFQRDATNTTILVDNGDEFAVNGIKAVNVNGTINIETVLGGKILYTGINHDNVTINGSNTYSTAGATVDALNSLFAVLPLEVGGNYAPTFPTTAGVAVTGNTAEGQSPISGNLLGVDSDTSGHGARFWSDQTIDETGEYYEVKMTGKGRFLLGLYSVDDGHLAEITNDAGNAHSGYLWSNAFYNYGSYIAPWTYYGDMTGVTQEGWNGAADRRLQYKTSLQDNFVNGDPVLFKVGITTQGYIGVWYYDEGVTNDWIMTARTGSTIPAGQYGLLVKLWDGTAELVETPKRVATDPAAPALNYRYIESPDGVFHYPLFATAEEANYVDTANGGGGTSTGHVFVDESTGATWYAPTTGYTDDGTVAPSDTSEITWSGVPTEADGLHAPTPFSDAAFTVDENSAINIQVVPAGASWDTTIVGDSAFSLDAGGHIVGTAPEVTGDNVANPDDEYVVQVVRSNTYGSSTGEVTLTVTNLTAPVTAISGFSHVAGSTALIDSDTMDDGSVVHVNNTVADGERFVIEKAYIETNILPALQANGDQYIIGLHNTSSDFSTLEVSDFDATIVWQYESATSHTFKFYRDGVVQQNIVVNSLTQAHYDYAIEVDGTSAWLIACNVNSIMNEPSPSEGGSFTNTYEVTNTEDTAPLQIHMAALNTTADISTTDISTVTVPAPPASTTTPYNKAIDFNGSSERLKQVSQSTSVNAMRMNGLSEIVTPNADNSKTSTHWASRPWATTIVFKPDGNNSNQHIWNSGEGTATGDDNVYLRLSAGGQLYFGWGREGTGYNEKQLATVLGGQWFGVYIGFKGARFSSADATAANLDGAFDIRVARPNDIRDDVGADQYLVTPSGYWMSTGYRMDRDITGDFTIGGRGANRSFHGDVASMVITTLRKGRVMPDDAEIKMMLTNPKRWEEDYKEGQSARYGFSGNNFTYSSSNSNSKYATQIWLMGDGVNDALMSNGIRNQVDPTDQNSTRLQGQSLVSNDEVFVTISGLT